MACEHRGCRCEEQNVRRGDKEYCSDFCANAQTTGASEATKNLLRSNRLILTRADPSLRLG